MRTWAKGTSRAAVLTAGFVALGVSAIPANAYADITDGTGSVLGGNQVAAPISAPVDVSGNAAALLGTSSAGSVGGAKVRGHGDGGGQMTSGTGGVLSGNQVNAPVSAPVNVCGNAVAVLGHTDAGCKGGAKVVGGGSGGQVTDGTGGVIAGNQANAPISIPANVCGNAVAIAGFAVAGCEGGSAVKGGSHVMDGGRSGAGQETSGLFGTGSGNQAGLPVSAPADVCGNAVGDAAAACAGGASTGDGGYGTGGGQVTDGTGGVISGNQASAPIGIVANVCGNAVAVLGQAAAFCEGGAHAGGGSGGDQSTSGVGGVLSGNQGNVPVSPSANVCGNAAAVIGFAVAACEGGPGHDDGYPHHRTARAGEPLPLNPGAATLPDPPKAGAKLPKGVDPSALKGLPKVDGLLKGRGLPKTDGVSQTGRQSPATTLPKSDGLPKTLPKTDALPKGGLPKGGLPKGGLPKGGLPKGKGLPSGTRAHGSEGPKTLPAPQQIPGVPGGDVLPAKPVVPKLKTVTEKLPEPAGAVVGGPVSKVVPATGELGPVKKVAAEETITGGADAGATWTLAVSGMLAATAGALALSRRARTGRR
ncbi:chaplin family protein [Actinomadura sp. KC06]|uniref:chaplin family protein n=1 Tax=Actinomadura sp. KC06 TaxID=2530369 RepID=UPI001405019A|nr:chaplin family protein [Actinomadura sp. KC06]